MRKKDLMSSKESWKKKKKRFRSSEISKKSKLIDRLRSMPSEQEERLSSTREMLEIKRDSCKRKSRDRFKKWILLELRWQI